ncbi:MAG: HAAS signaling domain-containing protein [Anaerocolumna sp.]
MTKEEFIDGLRTALMGEIPDSEVYTNIKFYEDYIRDKSKTEGEDNTLAQLGDPRLIAKTIIETYQISHGPIYNNVKSNISYQDADTNDWNKSDNLNHNYDDFDRRGQNNSNSRFNINIGVNLTWYQKVLLILILCFTFIVLLIIGGVVLQLFISIGIPILLVYLGYRLIFGNRRL